MFTFPSLSIILSAAFMAYMAHTSWTFYNMFYPPSCTTTTRGHCIQSYLAKQPKLDLFIYTSTKHKSSRSHEKMLLEDKDFDFYSTIERELNVSLPQSTRNNGTLYVHVYVVPSGLDPYNNANSMHASASLTVFSTPQFQAINLIGSNSESERLPNGPEKNRVPITHWRSVLVVNVLSDIIDFDRTTFPVEIATRTRLASDGTYLPVVYIDSLSNRIKDLQLISPDTKTMALNIRYSPISVGKLRLWTNMEESIKQLHNLGFTEKDTDEVKGIFSDTNLYLLLITFIVSAFHLVFDFLAFKNDISYWKNRDSMVGLSTRVVIWRCFSTFIIFLYLLDEETSLLVLIPAGIGSVIEVWKVTKAFKMKVTFSGLRPSLKFGTTTDKEQKTEQYDSMAMKYLSYVLYPLCIAGAVYSLLYTPHKSWYSWCIQSMVNGVYAFGFLFMLPQLFVNYKLKSVAHLPWRAFMYKAFNTFIDDIFAFIIAMPTTHRLACFRDDLVFVVYLYQRWLYPVDKTRVNEYGQSFDEKSNESKKDK